MKRAAIVIAAVCLTVLLAGCFGGGGTDSTSGSTTETPAASTSGTPVAVNSSAPVGDPDQTVPRDFEKKPSTPDFFVDALKKNQPILIVFYGQDSLSQDVLAEAKKVYEDQYYKGGAVFLFLKIDDKDTQIKKLSQDFSVGYIPYTAVVSRKEKIVFEKNGYLDHKVIEQALYNAMNKSI